MYLVGSVWFGSDGVRKLFQLFNVHCVQCLLSSKCRTNLVADLKWKASPVSDETQDKFILFVIAIVFSLLLLLFFLISLLYGRTLYTECFCSLQPLSYSSYFFYVHYLCCYICLHFRFHSIFQFYMFTHEVFSLHTHHWYCVCIWYGVKSASDLEMPSISFN